MCDRDHLDLWAELAHARTGRIRAQCVPADKTADEACRRGVTECEWLGNAAAGAVRAQDGARAHPTPTAHVAAGWCRVVPVLLVPPALALPWGELPHAFFGACLWRPHDCTGRRPCDVLALWGQHSHLRCRGGVAVFWVDRRTPSAGGWLTAAWGALWCRGCHFGVCTFGAAEIRAAAAESGLMAACSFVGGVSGGA